MDYNCSPKATCEWTESEQRNKCICNAGYEGDGFKCTELEVSCVTVISIIPIKYHNYSSYEIVDNNSIPYIRTTFAMFMLLVCTMKPLESLFASATKAMMVTVSSASLLPSASNRMIVDRIHSVMLVCACARMVSNGMLVICKSRLLM